MNDLEKKATVLVVDDERNVLKFLDINLKYRGYKVITATSGEEALDLIKLEKPQIVLLDIVIPGKDGFEVLNELRAFSRIPVIAFSASIDNYQKSIQLGANAFISKPFNIEDMVSKINLFLSN